MKTAFIICSRITSSRVPAKAFIEIEGKPVLQHLIDRLMKTELPIILAVPEDEAQFYKQFLKKRKVMLFTGFNSDPLARMSAAAKKFKVESIVRVTHDKVFIDEEMFRDMLEEYVAFDLDYIFSSKLLPGTGFEIIRAEALHRASEKFKEVEFIGYAVRALTNNYRDFIPEPSDRPNARLLIDYPEDVRLINLLFSCLGADATLEQVLQYLSINPWAMRINSLPKLTVYTCAYNAENFISQALVSVQSQNLFKDIQYIIVDDHSSDRTTELVARFCTENTNCQWIRNSKNMGLAASSNIALGHAKAPYILRLDADDLFTNKNSCSWLLNEITERGKDVIIPNNYFGSFNKIQKGREGMHIGGSIFRTSAVNHVKFNDKLRNYEGLDFFTRARDTLDIGFLNKPLFFYTQRPDSMSKTNLEERKRTKEMIESRA